MKLLVSVRDTDEALAAAAAGADFIDGKEPSAGALGALPLDTLGALVRTLRAARPGCAISATVGDFAPDAVATVLARAAATAACGVDYVKVGVAPGASALLDALAASALPIVPVFIADAGLDEALVARACAGPFPALMVDTADKGAGSLLTRLPEAALARFVRQARAAGKLSGLAGALRADDLPALRRLGPDFAGFRSAVCGGTRSGVLDAERVRGLRTALADTSRPARRVAA